jgi:hypothetical protein
MKPEHEIVYDMCVTSRHDYGIDKSVAAIFSSGMTSEERVILWEQMEVIYDKYILTIVNKKNTPKILLLAKSIGLNVSEVEIMKIVELTKIEIHKNVKNWYDEFDKSSDFGGGYNQGISDALCEIQIFGTELVE